MRKFSYSDDTLTQYGMNTVGYLEEDLPDFTSFDPDLGQEQYDRLKALVDWALLEGGDELNVNKLGALTDALNTELEKARKLYHQLRYWIIKAFPNRKAVQRQFGVGRFSKVSKSQTALISFFTSLTQSVADYRTQLEAVNTPAALMDAVGTQAEALNTAQSQQEKKKGNRTVDTEARVNQLNELYAITQAYNAAAEHVYYDSPAKRDRYRPPSNAIPADEDDGENE